MEKLKQKIENVRNNNRTRAAIGAVTLLAALGASEATPAVAHAAEKTSVNVLEKKTHRDLTHHRGVQVAHGTLMIRKQVGERGHQYETTKYVENPVIADRQKGSGQDGPVDVLDLESGRYAFGSISRKGHNQVDLHKLSHDGVTVEFIPELKTTTPDTLVQTVDFGEDRDGHLRLSNPFLTEGTQDPLLDPAGNPAAVALEYRSHK
jgi:hypothetical protein